MTEKPPTEVYRGVETNLHNIARIICSVPPKAPCSYGFIMDESEDTDELSDTEFDMLKTFTLACIETLYGADFNPLSMDDEQLTRVQRYINSVGYYLIREIDDLGDSYRLKIRFEPYNAHNTTHNPYAHLAKYAK